MFINEAPVLPSVRQQKVQHNNTVPEPSIHSGPTFALHLHMHNGFKPGACVCVYLFVCPCVCVYMCVCAAGRLENVVCGSVYFCRCLISACHHPRSGGDEQKGRLWPPQGTPRLELAYSPNEAVFKNINTHTQHI